MDNRDNISGTDSDDFILEFIHPETKKKLLRLAEFLPSVSENRFDMNVFYLSHTPETQKIPSLSACNTVACAAGWATQIPEFKEAGPLAMNDCTPPAAATAEEQRQPATWERNGEKK